MGHSFLTCRCRFKKRYAHTYVYASFCAGTHQETRLKVGHSFLTCRCSFKKRYAGTRSAMHIHTYMPLTVQAHIKRLAFKSGYLFPDMQVQVQEALCTYIRTCLSLRRYASKDYVPCRTPCAATFRTALTEKAILSHQPQLRDGHAPTRNPTEHQHQGGTMCNKAHQLRENRPTILVVQRLASRSFRNLPIIVKVRACVCLCACMCVFADSLRFIAMRMTRPGICT